MTENRGFSNFLPKVGILDSIVGSSRHSGGYDDRFFRAFLLACPFLPRPIFFAISERTCE